MSETAPDAPQEVRIRRAPRIGMFLAVGAVVGVLGTLILTSLYPADPSVGFAASFGYFALYGVPAGVLLGAIVSIVLDAISTRRARNVAVERVTAADDPGRPPSAG